MGLMPAGAQGVQRALAGGFEIPAAAPSGVVAEAELPDSPGYSSSLAQSSQGGYQPATNTRPKTPAGRLEKVIQPGQTAEKLTIGDKVLIGVRENATLPALAGWVISAGYEQAVNGSPNYGQTGKGFAQRLGAAAARSTSENIFSDSIIAPVLHQDPRYYRLGPEHNFVKRVLYAGTRGLITRTDGGRTTFNFSNVGGDLGGSALTQLYYPSLNRNFTDVMRTWGGSMGGDALGYLVSEFFPGGFTTFHVHKPQD